MRARRSYIVEIDGFTGPKRVTPLQMGDVRVLNPRITFLYKTNKTKIDEKEVTDIMGPYRGRT
jgi:hypothetical protein